MQESSDFSARIKGRTLKEILDRYFPDQKQADEVIKRLSRFEQEMVIEYIPGAREFILGLKEQGVKLAIVTSSNDLKMQNVYRLHPEVKKVFDVIITADKITRSKPDPEVFLKAASFLSLDPGVCLVVEDAHAGVQAARAGGFDCAAMGDAREDALADYHMMNFAELLQAVSA